MIRLTLTWKCWHQHPIRYNPTVAEDKNNEQEKFDFTAEGERYISLDEARVLAMRTALESPGDYGRNFRRVAMVFEVSSLEETDDFYEVILSFGLRRILTVLRVKNSSL